MLPIFLIFIIFSSTCAANEIPALPNNGTILYESACVQCHSPMRAKAIGAPEAFNVPVWDARFANAKAIVAKDPKRFVDEMAYLVHQIKIGKGLMQHGGLCVESGLRPEQCVDSAYQEAIEYMRNKLVTIDPAP